MNYTSRSVNELMRINPINCDPEVSVLDAARLMAEKGVGSLMVVKEDKPLGIVTERDILAKVVAAGKKPEKMKLAEIMTSPLLTVTPSADITEVARLMAKHNVRRLGVVSQEQLVGIITTADIMSVSTHLISTSEDLRNLVCRDSDQGEYVSGYCEECKTYSINLASIEGMLVCEQCRDGGE